MNSPTWQNTLHATTNGVSIKDLANTSHTLGYEFMCWNDRVYRVFFEHPAVTWVDTNLLMEDIGKNYTPTTKASVVLACTMSSGEPAMVRYNVEYTSEQYDNGEHYEMAKEKAIEEGYEGQFVCFDSSEYYQVVNMGEELKEL